MRAPFRSPLLLSATLATVALAGCSETQLGMHLVKRAAAGIGAAGSSDAAAQAGAEASRRDRLTYLSAAERAGAETGIAILDSAPDAEGLTASHPSLPIGSQARVTNLSTGQVQTVRIARRSDPRAAYRIALSRNAAARTGVLADGAAMVRIDADEAAFAEARRTTPDATRPAFAKADAPSRAPIEIVALDEPIERAPRSAQAIAENAAFADDAVFADAAANVTPRADRREMRRAATAFDPQQVRTAFASTPSAALQRAPSTRRDAAYVQFGAFGAAQNAQRMRDRLIADGLTDAFIVAAEVDGRVYHRVRIGPVANAADALRNAKALGHNQARIAR